jgi:hypothetical protein
MAAFRKNVPYSGPDAPPTVLIQRHRDRLEGGPDIFRRILFEGLLGGDESTGHVDTVVRVADGRVQLGEYSLFSV